MITFKSLLLQFKGRNINELYANDRNGKPISIKTAYYRHVDSHLMKFRRKNAQQRQIDFTNNKEMLVDPIDCFDNPTMDYSKADAILQTLQLSDIELKVLNCYLNGMKQAQVISSLGIQQGSVNYRKACIRQKFQLCFGTYHGSAYSYN